MKRCTHPTTALEWKAKDGVFVCRKCGQVIFPVSEDAPDEAGWWDAALCGRCGGTGHVEGAACEACQGEGYISQEER